MGFIPEKIKVICGKLKSLSRSTLTPVNDFLYCATEYKTSNDLPSPENMLPFDMKRIVEGNDDHLWFYKKLAPVEKEDGKKLFLSFKTGYEGAWDAQRPQSLVYVNGRIKQGIDTNHTDILLEYGKEHEIYIYYYSGSLNARSTITASLDLVDERVEKLYYDLTAPYEALSHLDPDSDAYLSTIRHLELAVNMLDLRVPKSDDFYASAEKADEYLEKNFYGKACGGINAVVDCIGHTHIDVAWLWPVKQTVEKAQRSFATVLDLMDRYPEYKFMSSQPQLYEFVKDQAPELYERIKQRVREGRWEVEGGMWLEADCNLTSGESLVRQILFGKRFMKSEFGVDSRIVWLPDVFGYSAAMPQIMKKSGIDRFVTSKISWNETNVAPYDSFTWQGIDGSEVFTFFITARGETHGGRHTTYVGKTDPNYIMGTWKRYQQKEYNNETIITFGYGDGGGGPTSEMLEYQRRMARGLPGFPKTQIKFAGDFLENAERNFKENSEILGRSPKWVGELYLEFHRGTYTSMAKNKKNNRRSEQLLQSLEKISVSDMLLLGGKYDGESINRKWKTVLLDQFHDILPGSSVLPVYEQTDRDYAYILSEGNAEYDEKFARLKENVGTSGGVFVYNPNGFECSDNILIDGRQVFVKNIPACGYAVVSPEDVKNSVKITGKTLENGFFRLVFDDTYAIVSLYDKRNCREVVKKGKKYNELRIFEDFPKEYDAWEITDYYKQKMRKIENVSEVRTLDEGARKGIEITRTYLSSVIVQRIYLYDDIERIDVENRIDWKEEHMLLKAAFPTDVHANEATYEIQFGHLRRPTHENTSWDKAKFEVCAHKWADISDDGYGVSIVNDCKYGHSAEGNTLSLSLLKCATYPNPKADKELHEFRYSIIPHAENFRRAGTVKAAQLFNNPLKAEKISAQSGVLAERFSLVSCDAENVMIDTVKKAEEGDAVIVRAYEAFDRRTSATFTLGFGAKKAFICDLLENEQTEIPVTDGKLKLDFGNFEIVTVKIIR